MTWIFDVQVMLLIAVASWIIFTLPIGFIHPPVVSCKFWNGSEFLLKLPSDRSAPQHMANSEWDHTRQKRSAGILRRPTLYHLDTDDDILREPLTPDTVDELPRALPVRS